MGQIGNWAEAFDAQKEQERIERERMEEIQEAIEVTKVTVGLRMEEIAAEMVKMFAEKYHESFSAIGANLLQLAIFEAVQGIGEDTNAWAVEAAKRIEARKDKK